MVKSLLNSIAYRMADNKKRVDLLRKKGMSIGEHCEIVSNASFGSEPYLIKMGNHVKITNGVNFITHDGGMFVLRNLNLLPQGDVFGKITVGDNVFIGNKATIMPGVTIGNNVVIGYGSIVTKDIPSNTVAVGIPARAIETIDEYYYKVKDKSLKTKGIGDEEKKRIVLDFFEKDEAND